MRIGFEQEGNSDDTNKHFNEPHINGNSTLKKCYRRNFDQNVVADIVDNTDNRNADVNG